MLSRFVPTKPKNFQDFCILGFLNQEAAVTCLYKLHELTHLSIFEKLTSIYIFKLGISHYVLIGPPEVISSFHHKTCLFCAIIIGTHQKQALYFFRVHKDQ